MWILVSAEIENRIVLFEYMLCAVTMMNVEIYHKDLVIADFLGISRTYSHVVEYTEPHGPICLSVMARRSHCAKSPLQISLSAPVDSAYHSTSREKGRLH